MKKLRISLMVFGLIILFQSPILAQSSEKLFQQGMMKEEGEGNLNEAIVAYNQIVNDISEDRKLRAKALLQVGICYEKQGNQKARKSYQKLIVEFADQPDIAAIGKEKLKGLKKENQPKKNGVIIASQINSPEGEGGRISQDGQSLIYVDWTTKDNKPAINIKNLRNGKTRIVSKVGTWNAPIKFPDNPIWSPDGKQFAYYWYDKVEGKCEFHIANSDGTNDKVISKGNHIDVLYPLAWAPDGKYILCANESKEGDNQALLFSVKDKSSKIIKRFKKKGGKANFSPDSKYIVYAMQQTETSKENDIYIISIDGTIDKKIISNAANDFDPIWSPDGKHILFISDRYGTNDLWKIEIENGLTVGTAKLVKSNLGNRGDKTIILGITKNQSLYYETASSRKDIYLLKVQLNGNTNINAITRISDLKVKNNTNPAITADGRYIAFVQWQLTKDPNIIGRPFFISIYDTKTGETKTTNSKTYVLSQLGWYYPHLQWSPNGDKILLQGRRKVKKNLISGVFIYDVETEEFETILEVKDYKGFTATPSTGTGHKFSNDGKHIYYLSNDRKNINKIELKTNKVKVAYTNANTMGRFHFSNDESKLVFGLNDIWNELYLTNILSGETKKIVNLDNDNTPSVIGWDFNDNYIYYANEQSWEPNSIMRISAEGGVPKKLITIKDTFPDGSVLNIVLNKSNKTMAAELEVEHIEMWKLDGVFKD